MLVVHVDNTANKLISAVFKITLLLIRLNSMPYTMLNRGSNSRAKPFPGWKRTQTKNAIAFFQHPKCSDIEIFAATPNNLMGLSINEFERKFFFLQLRCRGYYFNLRHVFDFGGHSSNLNSIGLETVHNRKWQSHSQKRARECQSVIVVSFLF